MSGITLSCGRCNKPVRKVKQIARRGMCQRCNEIIDQKKQRKAEEALGKKWIQYAHADTDKAAILQVANSRTEAMQDDEVIMSGCPWYCYDFVNEQCVNEDGPHYFGKGGN